MQFFLMFFYLGGVALAIYLINNQNIEWKRVLSLVLLTPLLFGIIVFLVDIFVPSEDELIYGNFSAVLLTMLYTLLIMLPSLMIASVGVLIFEKKFNPTPLKLFLWAIMMGGTSAIIPSLFISPIFIIVAMVLAPLVVMIEHYYLGGSR